MIGTSQSIRASAPQIGQIKAIRARVLPVVNHADCVMPAVTVWSCMERGSQPRTMGALIRRGDVT